MFGFKKKNEVTVLKGFVSYEAYYPEVNMFKTDMGFVKAYELHDVEASGKEEYVKQLASYIRVPQGGALQFCHIKNLDAMVVTAIAETPEEAVTAFEALAIPLTEISCEKWITVISDVTKFHDFEKPEMIGAVTAKGKPACSVLPLLQPYHTAKTGKHLKHDNRFLEVEGRYVQTMVFSNFPSYVYPSFLTEIIRISPKIMTSLHIRSVDTEKCLKAFEKLKIKMSDARIKGMKEALMSGKALYHSQLLVSVNGNSKDEVVHIINLIRDIAERYLVSVNFLEYQQMQAYKSVVPLGKTFVRNAKVLSEEQIMGLLPLSWMRHVANGICYGRDCNTGIDIFYNRLMTRENGFILGSDCAFVEKRILSEIEQMRALKPDIRVSIFTVDPSSCQGLAQKYGVQELVLPMLSGEAAIDKEILRLVTIGACGNNGDLSREKKAAMEQVLNEEVSSYPEFIAKINAKNPNMGRQLMAMPDFVETKYSESGVQVFFCGGTSARYVQRMAVLINALLKTSADLVYVVSAEALSDSYLIKKILKVKGKTIFTFASLTNTGDGLRKLYLDTKSKDAIYNADFLDISCHETADRVRLRGILEFDRRENGVLSAKDSGSGLLITKEATYIYESEEEKKEAHE